ncbi:hypothetical protein NFI95_11350 [Acetobacteraceae bacterium KSS8]|uniref:Uncharacterized protein n=1 Tax=Endosaccharibacter trunci TaxID=2812733 RepID=A0ABT1W832_9PROT|nr:hypothetical protein [Acetobacteraceae bacterium KSS8]
MSPTSFRSILFLFPLLAVAGCAVPSAEQRRALDSMIGRSETDLLRTYGVPTRTFSTNGHTFLAYVQNETSFSPGTPGWGGWGWGGGWGGWGGGWGPGWGGWGGGWGGGFPPSYYQSSCATTFEVNNGVVAGWTLRGDGC